MKIETRVSALERENATLRSALQRQHRFLLGCSLLFAGLWLAGAGESQPFQEVVRARRFEVITGEGDGYAVVSLDASVTGDGQLRILDEAGNELLRAGSVGGDGRLELGSGDGHLRFSVSMDEASSTLVRVLGVDGNGGISLRGATDRSALVLRDANRDRLTVSAGSEVAISLLGREGANAARLMVNQEQEGTLHLFNPAGAPIVKLGGFGRARKKLAAYAALGGVVASWPPQPALPESLVPAVAVPADDSGAGQ